MSKKIILASQSPRRKELLQKFASSFEVEAANIDERAIQRAVMEEESDQLFIDQAKILVERLAAEKAKAVLKNNPEALVIGADTVVAQDDRILGKPKDKEEAYQMLRSYSGGLHTVLTGFSVQTNERTETYSVETEVYFFDWNEQMDREMKSYIATGKPMDKAGAYGIQEEASLWIEKIHGDYPNVIGLPIAYANRVLQRFI